MKNKFTKVLGYFIICMIMVPCTTLSQTANVWNPNYSIGTSTGYYNFSYLQTPDPIVEQLPPNITVVSGGISYQWEQSSTPVASGFTPITGSAGTASSYTFTGPLSQTTYFRRKTYSTTNSSNYVYSNIVKISVISINWEDINYVREHDVDTSGITDWKTADQLPIGEKLQTTTYLDGLGRTVQKISRETATPSQSGNTWGDMVQFIQYDAFGRTPTQYLPYTTTTESGKFKSGPLTEQPQYYTNVYNETSAYTTTTYDNSPLNRVMNVKSPGTSWAASAGNSATYDMNDVSENVQIFTIGYNTGDAPISTGVYSTNTLFKTSHTDENGKTVIEYTDKSGQLILTKVQIDDNPSVAHTGWICTYSVYDDFGHLRYRIQPEAVKWLDANGWSFAGTDGQQVLNGLCFRYEYDDKARTILKKAPGAKELYMLYDARDRVVFMQDGNQRDKSPGEWTANLYDYLDRPVITTLYTTSETQTQLQSDITNATTTSTVTISNPGAPVIDLIVDTRQAGIATYTAQNEIDFVTGFESLDNDEFVAEIDSNAVSPTVNVTTIAYNSPISTTDLNNPSVDTIIKYYFYDDYSYGTAKPFTTNFDNILAYSNGDPITPTQRTMSMVTGTMVRVLGTNTFLTSSLYYDEKGRSIQTLEDNIKSGQDVTTLQYQFDGRVLSSNTKHSTVGSGYTNYSIVTKSIFDKIGRVTSTAKKYGTNDFKTVASYDYDDIGRLKTKHLDPGYTGSGKSELEALAYSFNIHNEITGINKDYALKTSGTYDKWGSFFGLYLGYDNRDNVFANAQLNGQVTGTLWTTQGDDAQRKYDFTYDNAGRLANAQFNERQTTGDSWSHTTMDFSVTGSSGAITYDLNGNLLTMLQKGVLPGNTSPVNVDNLQYTYTSLSNKLLKVMDSSTLGTANGKLGDFSDGANGSNNDYVYDDNGNLVIDLNKNVKELENVAGANGIRYNFLDKPEEIHISGKGTIQIVYDADGNKLQRIYTPNGGTAVTTTYINEFVYRGDSVEYINFEEGRIRAMQPVSQNNGYDMLTMDGNMDLPDGRRGAYDYFIRDYQSNVRMILTEEIDQGSNSCTMETYRAAIEEPIFGQVDSSGNPTANNEVRARFAISGIPGQTSGGGWQSDTSNYVSQIGNLASSKVGPNTLQKVMAGDQISATTIYYYQNPVINQSGATTLLTDLLSSLGQAISGGAVSSVAKNGAGNITSLLSSSVPFADAIAPDANNASGTNPKAYLNIVFFDERFNFVADGSTSLRVSQSGDGASPLVLANIKAPKNGYVYVYVSNESDEMVYFDNLQVSNNHGRIIEEDHYYSFGLRIAGISSRKIPSVNEGDMRNHYQYQGDYSEMDETIGWNDFELRNYDPQIGRWIQQDPYEEFPSPYVSMGNDPISNNDPDGGGIFDGLSLAGKLAVGGIGGAFVGGIVDMATGGNGWKGAGIGAAIGAGAASGSWSVTTSIIVNMMDVTANVLSSSANFSGVGMVAHGGPNLGDITYEAINSQISSCWLLYNGTNVNIYQGEYGNTNELVNSFKGTSGIITFKDSKGTKISNDYRNAKYQYTQEDVVEEGVEKKIFVGPLPEGNYSVDLSLDPDRQANLASNGETTPGEGMEKITYTKNNKEYVRYPAWGSRRARLDPDPDTKLGGRDGNFYFHNSHKGYTHGCIETEPGLFTFLRSIQKSQSSIRVKIKYISKNASTNGSTDY